MTHPRGPLPPTYDPERIDAQARAMGWRYRARQWDFAWNAFQAFLWIVLVWLSQGRRETQVAFARWSRHAMIRRGAVFIKLGQMLSTRVDAFGPEILAELSHLQDKVPSFPFEQVRAIIEEDLGAPLDTLFARFDAEPLAAASMGQVHAATLPDGSDAVIKVLRPELEAHFVLDLAILRRFAEWVSRQTRLLAFVGGSASTPYVGLVDRLGVSLYQQLDLWTEGLHGERFARNFAKNPRVTAPAIYWSHSSTRLLAQERIYGYRFDDEAGIRAAGIDYLEIAEIGIRAFTKQIFEDAFFHADSHPGNIFVTPEGVIVYLDFGMVEVIDEEFQAALVEMFIHVIQQNWSAFLEDMVRAEIVPAETPRELLLPIFTDVWAAQLGFTDKRYTLQEVSDRFYAIVREYPFRLPERFLFLTRTAASLEGVVYRADPSFKFLPIALPFFAKLVLTRIDMENPWIIQDMLESAADGVAFERLAELVRFALADEPEQMAGVVDAMIEVVVHPQAAPLRAELSERLLRGDLTQLAGMLPGDFALSPRALAHLEAFLKTRAGRAWVLSVLEDPRCVTLLSSLLESQAQPIEVPLDWLGLFLYWFPAGAERQEAYRLVHRLLGSPDFPWRRLVDPQAQIQQLQRMRQVAGPEHLPVLLDFLAHRDTLPVLAKGMLRGWTERLTGVAPLALLPSHVREPRREP